MRGDFQRARPLFEESLELRRRGGEPRAIALTACNLAQLTLADGDLEVTEALLAEALEHARAINYQPMILTVLGVGALTSLRRGDTPRAQARLADAADSMMPGLDQETGAVVLAAAATLAAIGDDPLRAATLWAAADQAIARLSRAETPGAATLRARWLPHARAAAPDATSWAAAWTAGIEISLDEALSFAASAQGSVGAFPPSDRS
jgi:hypothetical protein